MMFFRWPWRTSGICKGESEDHKLEVGNVYPLVNVYSLLLKMAIEIVDFPIQKWWIFPQLCGCLPEGIASTLMDPSWVSLLSQWWIQVPVLPTLHTPIIEKPSYGRQMSPAVALSQGQKYNHMVDMWAFGVLMYLLMYGHYPSLVDQNPDFEPLIQEPFEITGIYGSSFHP